MPIFPICKYRITGRNIQTKRGKKEPPDSAPIPQSKPRTVCGPNLVLAAGRGRKKEGFRKKKGEKEIL